MNIEAKLKLKNVIDELLIFLERDFSSQFRNLTDKEDRQLFFLAKILTRLKQIYRESPSEKTIDKKVLQFPVHIKN